MKRRAFFSAFGIGTAATVAAGVSVVHAASPHPEKRDIHWAKARVKDGHRVRLESWRVPMHERPPLESNPDAGIQIQMGSPAGLSTVNECAVTVEMLEGPWEIVPTEDYPKPFEPRQGFGEGGDVTITGGDGGARMVIRGGDGTGSNGRFN